MALDYHSCHSQRICSLNQFEIVSIPREVGRAGMDVDIVSAFDKLSCFVAEFIFHTELK